jgi:hypothetical protein
MPSSRAAAVKLMVVAATSKVRNQLSGGSFFAMNK